MADTKAPAKAKAKAVAPKTPRKNKKVSQKRGKPRNYELKPGIVRFTRSRMYHKKALWKFVGKKTPKPIVPKKPITVVKKIKGDKNGGTRTVLVRRRKAHYPVEKKVTKHPSKKCFYQHKRHIRGSLQKGTVLILLAGRHKGKRVVLLKTMKSGLLLINGPFKFNGCPLRRISPNYVIATSTKLDLSNVEIPKHINDSYFRRHRKILKLKNPEVVDGEAEEEAEEKVEQKVEQKDPKDIFASKKESYRPNEQRKTDQEALDKSINDVIRQRPDKKLMFSYLSRMWGLRSSQYPHRMKF